MNQNLQLSDAKTFWAIWSEPSPRLSKRQKIYAAIVFLTGAILSDSLTKGYLLSLLVRYGETAVITGGILRVVGTLLIATPTAFFIFKKFKSYCMGHLDSPKIFIIVGSIISLALFAAYSYKSVVATDDFYRSQQATRAASNKRILQLISQEVPIEKKTSSKIDIPKLTYLYAKDIYTYEGRIIEYHTAEDDTRTYTPTAEDQKMRDILLFMQIYTKSTKTALIIYGSFAAISIIGALVVGFSSRRETNVS